MTLFTGGLTTFGPTVVLAPAMSFFIIMVLTSKEGREWYRARVRAPQEYGDFEAE